MKYPALAIFAALCVGGCAPDAILPRAQVVTVDGHPHTVRRSGDTYTATMNGRQPAEGQVYVGNLRAIRDVTGCPVAAGSVRNEGGRTTASVTCPADRTAQL